MYKYPLIHELIMPADIVNTTITGQLISTSDFLGSSLNTVLIVLFVAVILGLLGVVFWARYRK